jgi:hypothetical protein
VGQKGLKATIQLFFFAKPPKCSFGLLLHTLNSSEVIMRGRTAIDLVPYKAQIIPWFQDENKTSDEISSLL